MAPIPSKVNDAADELVNVLRQVGRRRDSSRWITDLKTVKRGFFLEALTTADRPAVRVQVGRWEDEPQQGGQHYAKVHLWIHCFVDAGETADEQLNNLLRDVIDMITSKETLNDKVSFIRPVSYTPNLPAIESLGVPVATLTCEAEVFWQHGAP